MSNVTKKAVSVLLIFFVSLSMCFCSYQQRVDFSECVRRMNRLNDSFEIEEESAFYSEGEWYVFVDASGEDDILVTGREDDGRLLTRLTVSVINNGEPQQKQTFIGFCEAAVGAFCENADKQKILADSHLYDENVLFTDTAFFGENGRFRTCLYSAAMGSTFVIEIIR